MESGPRVWIKALHASHARLAELVDGGGPQWLGSPSYADGWTIAQVLSHLGSGAEIASLVLSAALDGGQAVTRETFAPIWAAWDAKTPGEQAADCLAADSAHIRSMSDLSDSQLAAIRYEFFGMDLDAVGMIRLRLAEHALHTWDVAVAAAPAARVAPDAVGLLTDSLPFAAGRLGKAEEGPLRARLRVSDGGGDYLLDVADTVTLSPWPGGGAGVPADGEVSLTAEALLRLVYGRLDADHTPGEVSAREGVLGRLRKVFPGF